MYSEWSVTELCFSNCVCSGACAVGVGCMATAAVGAGAVSMVAGCVVGSIDGGCCMGATVFVAVGVVTAGGAGG